MEKKTTRKIRRGISITVILLGVATTFNMVEAKKDAKNVKSLVAIYREEGVILFPEKEEMISTHVTVCSGKNVEKEIYEQGVNCLVIGNTIFTEESKLVSKVTFHVNRKESIIAEDVLTEKGYYIFVEKEGYTLEGVFNVRYIDDYVTIYTDFDPAGAYEDVKIKNCQIIEIMDVEVRRSHPFSELSSYDLLYEENKEEEKGFSFHLVPRKKEDSF